MENKNPEEKVIIKYSSYTPAQKRATQKYRQNNKEKVNEQRKKYYQSRKEKDPDFLKYKREKAKEYYQRKKASKETLEEIKEEFLQAEPIPLIEQQEKIQEPEVVEVKPKKKRTPKKKEVEVSEELIIEHVIPHTELAKIIEETIASAPEVPKKKRASKKKSKEL